MKQLQIFILILLNCFAVKAQRIMQVHDGDTYKVLLNGKLQTVRLQNIDAPELDQHFGKAARDSVASQILFHTVQLDSNGRDLYGRLLVNIRIDGMSLDSLLIANGWAWVYTAYSTNPQLSIYEAAAKQKSLGLWQCTDPVPPWIWRKMNKHYKRLYEMCRPNP